MSFSFVKKQTHTFFCVQEGENEGNLHLILFCVSVSVKFNQHSFYERRLSEKSTSLTAVSMVNKHMHKLVYLTELNKLKLPANGCCFSLGS